MIQKIKNFLKSLFEKKKGEITELRGEIPPEEMEEKLPERIRDYLKQLEAKTDKYERELSEKEEAIKKLKEKWKEEEKAEAYEKEKAIEREKERSRAFIWFSREKPLLTSAYTNKEYFTDAKGKTWRQWEGLKFERTSSGAAFRFLLSNPDTDRIVELPRKRPIPLQYLPHIFDLGTLVSDLRHGRVPLYIKKSGDFVPPAIGEKSKGELKKIKEKFKEGELEGKETISIDIRNVLKNADKETRDAFFLLWDRYLKSTSKLKRVQKRAKINMMKKKEEEVTSEAASEALAESTSSLEMLTNKLETTFSRLYPLASSEQQARMKEQAYENTLEEITYTLSDIKDKIKGLSIPSERKAKEELLEDLEFISEELPPKVVKKGEG